jgi:hypothetical protein
MNSQCPYVSKKEAYFNALREHYQKIGPALDPAFPIEMYRIRQAPYKVPVSCKSCVDGIKPNCTECGGKGVHSKTKLKWAVDSNPVVIVRINRQRDDGFEYHRHTIGDLRYWETMCEFFEESSKLVHFTKIDAQDECDRRNNKREVCHV